MGIGDYKRYLDFQFGSISADVCNVTEQFVISSIFTVTPVTGGTIVIPDYSTVIFITNTVPYLSITIKFPSEPIVGKIISIVSNVDISNIFYTNVSFGMVVPSSLASSTPIKFIYTGSGSGWILI
jgi:hypothetical protein